MKELTIFTPTYNRCAKLRKLYDSLVGQTDKNFIWIIVDDGSTDETGKMISEWKKSSEFEIKYIYQTNQGKHIAMKRAFEQCATDWIICVDSDDYLASSAVQEMLTDMKSVPSDCIGYIYPRKSKSLRASSFPRESMQISIMDASNIYGMVETAILFKSKYLKLIEIPQYQDERFLSEEILYIQLDKFGKFCTRNQAFYISEYQSDGLTAHIFQLWKKNPKGTIRLLNDRYHYSNKYAGDFALKQKVKAILNLNGVCISTKQSIWKYTPNMLLSALLYIPSIVLAKIRFSK